MVVLPRFILISWAFSIVSFFSFFQFLSVANDWISLESLWALIVECWSLSLVWKPMIRRVHVVILIKPKDNSTMQKLLNPGQTLTLSFWKNIVDYMWEYGFQIFRLITITCRKFTFERRNTYCLFGNCSYTRVVLLIVLSLDSIIIHTLLATSDCWLITTLFSKNLKTWACRKMHLTFFTFKVLFPYSTYALYCQNEKL